MANRTYLLNTPILTSDPYLLRQRLQEPGNDYAEVAEGAYRIPVPWLCCFRPEDMRPVRVPLEDDDGGEGSVMEIRLPCTTVKQALLNLARAAPLFERLAGDARIGREFWLDAIAGLRALPLPYLTMDPIEVVFMGEPDECIQTMTAALAADEGAIPALQELSDYGQDVPPYPPDVLYVAAGPNHRRDRMDNTVALDAGIVDPDRYFWHRSAGGDEAVSPARPRPARPQPDLRSLHARVAALVKARQPSAHISFGFLPFDPPRPEQLKLCLWADTDAQCAALANDPSLRQELDGPLRAALEAVCAGHGFSWLGYVFFSTEAVMRDFKGKYDVWVNLPALGGP